MPGGTRAPTMHHGSPFTSLRRSLVPQGVAGQDDKPGANKSPSSASVSPAGAGRKGAVQKKPVQPDTSPTSVSGKAIKRGDEFGLEGTNKTVATPKPDKAPAEELGLGPYVEKSPYTRG